MNDTELAHHPFGPSRMKCFELCPAFRPPTGEDDKAGPAAERGSRIHKIMETGDFNFANDESEEEFARILMENVEDIKRIEFPNWNDETDHSLDFPLEEWDEITFRPIRYGKEENFGTLDKLFVCGPKAVAIDYKTGYMAIDDAEFNRQGHCYTVGVFDNHPEVQEVTVYFLIPNRQEVTSHRFTRDEDLPRLKLECDTIIVRAKTPEAELGDASVCKPMPGLCEFCGRQGTCGALANMALKIANSIDPELPPHIDQPNIQGPGEIGILMDVVVVMEKWAKAIRQQAYTIAFEEGFDIPGWRKVERNNPRTIKDIGAAFNFLKDHFGYTESELLSAVSRLSLTELENILAAKTPRGKKQKEKARLNDELVENDLLPEVSKTWLLQKDRE